MPRRANAEEETFQHVSAQCSDTTPKQANTIKKNGVCMLRKGQFPCKVVDVTISKTGKHGSAKVHLVGIDVFTSHKYEEQFVASKDVQCPNITKHEYVAINFTHTDNNSICGWVSVLDEQNQVKLIKVHQDNKCFRDFRAADFENKSYIVKTIKFGDREMIELLKED